MARLRVLLLHNHYQRLGGEDVAMIRERDLLIAHEHEVLAHAVSNDAVRSVWDRIRTGWQAPYSGGTRRQLTVRVRDFQPDVIHVHNFFPLLTPSIYDACRAASVPVVQTLHNYRMFCVSAQFVRDGHVCEDCVGKAVPWPGMLHACYRGSWGASGAAGTMLVLHRILRTWTEKVDLYIAPTEFVRDKFIQCGLPADKIVVKPHFVEPDPQPGDGRGGYALFVGRLMQEKGLTTLLAAWERLGGEVPLKIVGEGPLADQVVAATQRMPSLQWLGRQPSKQVMALMKGARALIFPSIGYESFGIVMAEAYAAGLPVIASNLGVMPQLVTHGRTGLLFRPGDSLDLAAKVEWLWTHSRERAEMMRNARREFEERYTAERNHQMLMDIYALVRRCSQKAPLESTH